MPRTADFLVVGGGIVGLTVALELKRRFGDARVLVIEKEPACGLHASGRNSGVLHAGFYYAADSLKAKLCRDGNRELSEYCETRGLRLNRCGKLVVARNEAELAGLDELLRRGRANGVELELISAEHARRIEPRIKTHERALWSPTTASVDPAQVMRSLVADARSVGIEIRTATAYRSTLHVSRFTSVRTSSGPIEAAYVVNAAGLYADRIAHDFEFAGRYRILPFKGLYLEGESSEQLATHVYPVPDLRNPFLGVHFTVTVDGNVTLGPTAIPAFWREHYGGLENFRPGELIEILWREIGLFLSNRFGFRRLAARELRKYSRRHLARLGAELVRDVRAERFRRWGRPGIRAQLLDLETGRLEMDFRYEGDDRSFHVLNAVSPAFTSALPFSRLVVDEIEHRIGSGVEKRRT